MEPTDNLLLDALPEAERDELLRVARVVKLPLGEVLYEQGEEVHEVHFLTSGAASVLVIMEDGSAVEPAVVGREGILGFPFGLGDNRSRWRSVMELPGEAYVVAVATMEEILRRPGELGPLLTHYAGLLVTFVAQSAACAQFHTVRERAARWVLLLHDRAAVDEFPITHEWLAHMLGAQRPVVTVALRELAELGLIAQQRGALGVTNRGGLEEITCECYARVQKPFEEMVYASGERSYEREGYQPGGEPSEGRGNSSDH